jgi:hypothetical protein
MGKKSRMKAERRTNGPEAKKPSIGQIMKAAEDARIMGIYHELQDAIAHKRKVELNDELFSHPENAHRIDKTFQPLEVWLDEQVRTGEADALPDGTVIIQPDGEQGAYYPVHEAFLAMAETYELIASDRKIPDQTDGVRKLGNRLKAHMPIDLPAVTAARESLNWMRSVTMQLSPNTYHPYLELISMRDDLRKWGLIAE